MIADTMRGGFYEAIDGSDHSVAVAQGALTAPHFQLSFPAQPDDPVWGPDPGIGRRETVSVKFGWRLISR
ncbi:hypothetical protein AYJ54_28165 [Bradyrhizobium centrolobii]|uniref:Uncharacterized protein n=1 Tax=Bradyrhizobium centrolobii TaxID=1505087 RepID=A0A176YAD1_9BRAD|nr:hypothetical protein AYJ54_28165 [Bradyrhizobium centrolobii]